MSDSLSLSQCGQFLTLNLIEDWDSDYLRLIVFQARNLQRAHGISRIQIEAPTWLNHTLSLEHILTVGEVMARLSGSTGMGNWKISVITPERNEQNATLEDILSLKDIELMHFQQTEGGLAWLLENQK